MQDICSMNLTRDVIYGSKKFLVVFNSNAKRFNNIKTHSFVTKKTTIRTLLEQCHEQIHKLEREMKRRIAWAGSKFNFQPGTHTENTGASLGHRKI